MKKHIRDALRLANVRALEVVTKGGHIHILLTGGRRVVCSCTPKDGYGAAREIARDLRRAAA